MSTLNDPVSPTANPVQPQPAATGSADGSKDLGRGISSIKSRVANVATNIYQYDTGGNAPRSKELSPDDHFEDYDRAQLRDLTGEVVFDEDEIRRLEAALCEHHILVLTGEEEVGKATIATLLAARVDLTWQDLGGPILISSGLAMDVTVSLDKVSEDQGQYAGRLLIFRDAFASRNPDLLRIPQELDSRRLGRLQARLASCGTFLILTTDRSKLPGSDAEERLKGLEILQEVKGPGPVHLLKDLHRRAAALGLSAGEEDRESLVRTVAEHGPRVVADLRSVSRLKRFVQFYLLDVARNLLDLDEALARARNREAWLLSELPKDLESWAFALALVLAQPLPQPDGVPWYPFYRLWREIAGHLRRELRLPRQPRAAQDLMMSRELLDNVRALVRSAPYPVAATVQFEAAIDPANLWEVLLGSGRSLTSSLVPLLQTLAEKGETAVLEVAAQALGRIGRLSPKDLVAPLIFRWSDSQAPFHFHVALGHLLHGVFGEADPSYREGCLRQFRHSALSRHGKDTWPGAVALREIGRLDLSLAVGELVDMLGRELRDRLGSVSPDDREVLRIFEEHRRLIATRIGLVEEEEDRIREVLDLATPVLFNEEAQQQVLAAVQYSLVGLCFSRGPIRVLGELQRRLLERVGGRLGPLLTLLYLRPDGIEDTLERNKTSVALQSGEDGMTTGTVSVHNVVLFAAFEDGAVEILRNFLEGVFRGSEAFPGVIARSFRARFVRMLKAWANDAVLLGGTLEICVALFGELLASKDQELRELVFQLLQRDPTSPRRAQNFPN